MITKKIITLTLLFCIFSCKKETLYQAYFDLNEQAWHSDSIIKFETKITDTINDYDVFLKIRHTTKYKYQNLFVFITMLEENNVFLRDTVEVYLHDKTGKPLGTGFGENREFSYKIASNLSKLGSCTILLEQAMRYGNRTNIERLEYLKSIGVSIKKTDE
jgi:gliding motility-associated lipoprotein GldH